ncbi:methyltransferase domain protein [Ceratobasidium sp. AG-Ba]|nr:methyltransferase domain protein [Ceratobasidium sp. AG-Ba]
MGVFAYYDTDTQGIVYHVIPGSESQYAPSAFSSETDSRLSRTTIQSDDLPGFFVLRHGRPQAANENVPKWFPSDNIQRYVIRYLIGKSVFGGNYVGPVKDILAPIEGRELRALELGTTTGTWIQAVATEFPHVQFRTLDVVPMIPHVPQHNIVFEVYDFAEGLRLEDESQDVVFVNLVLELVKDYRALLREVYRVLRPGGLIHVNDYNPGLWDPDDVTKLAERTNPRGFRFTIIVREAISALGVDPETCDKLPRWLAPGSEVWDNDQGGFKDIKSEERIYPFFPHDGHSCMNTIDASVSPYVRHFGATSLWDMTGLLKDHGLTHEEAVELIGGTLEEAKHHEGCTMFKIYCIYGTKN